MRTFVISDLHLGGRTGVDVLRRPEALDALVAALDGVDRLVLLGDLLELRHGPVHEALAAARPVLRAIGQALGPDAEVVLLAGNHDHRLVAPWLDWRTRAGRQPLRLEEHAGPRASYATRAIERMLAPARLDVAYPGLWLADGVYAMHGHYLDRHVTTPSFERLAAGALARLLRAPVADAGTPDDYERVLTPIYAILDAIAARAPEGGTGAHDGLSSKAWNAMSTDRPRPWQGRAMATAFPVAVAAMNRAGLGPVRADLSGIGLRNAGLKAMGAVVEHLSIDASHVIFGHTHRAGPLEGDEPAPWITPAGVHLHNTGSWVYESMYNDAGPSSPYWPGGGIVLDDGAPPRHVRLLQGVSAAQLTAPPARLPA
ncbi:MAG: metallophosphoesterase [Solirubrobacteraceae bacterium]